MELKKSELETPKEVTELGEALAAVLKSVVDAKADGWDSATDIPEIVMKSLAALPPAIDGLGELGEEFKGLPVSSTLGLIVPIAKEVDPLIASLKKPAVE